MLVRGDYIPSHRAPLIDPRGLHEVARPSTAVLSRCFELATGLDRKECQTTQQPKSDRAILKDVVPSKTAPLTRCYLIIEHDGDEYLGAVLCDDPFACRQIYRLLLNQRGEPIGKFGEIDVPELTAVTIIKRKQCKVCGSSDNCDFKVMDDAWKTTVPIEYRDQVVCGKCFEDFAD